MKLQDYLHYYLGCPCIYYMADDDPAGYHAALDYDLIKNWLANQEETDIKLQLRQLEDMTEEEAIAIARLCFFDRDKGYPDRDFKARKTSIGTILPSAYEVRIDNDWYDEVIKIGFNTGNIWRCNGSTEHLHNQSKVFHYLLQQHFDLFGLIPAGLAIDIKTTTP